MKICVGQRQNFKPVRGKGLLETTLELGWDMVCISLDLGWLRVQGQHDLLSELLSQKMQGGWVEVGSGTGRNHCPLSMRRQSARCPHQVLLKWTKEPDRHARILKRWEEMKEHTLRVPEEEKPC